MTRVETIGDATLYCGDCLEILPTLGKVDDVITDPPYGINYSSSSRSVLCSSRDYPVMHGDDKPFDPAPFLLGIPTVLWGANNYSDRLPSSRTWFIWYKREFEVTNDSADCEMAWTNIGGPARVFHHRWMGMLRDSERGESYHATQKPVCLMEWCLSRVSGETILDPFLGSGTTGVACVRLGRKFIGIEIDEKYFDTACKRIDREVRQGNLFSPKQPKPKQGELI